MSTKFAPCGSEWSGKGSMLLNPLVRRIAGRGEPLQAHAGSHARLRGCGEAMPELAEQREQSPSGTFDRQ